ncbi:MAG: bacteriohemerythrin [Treponema sp.]|nr:bacteriohemerythrin [Treponema sp.]
MQKIEWNDSYLLGISEIDNQHKKLLAVANDLYDAASGSAGNYMLKMSKVLKALTDYTVYHFGEEEKFMKKYGYEDVDLHKKEHDAFVAQVNNQIQRLGAGSQNDALVFYSFVAGWVLTHIADKDRVWAAFVKPQLV